MAVPGPPSGVAEAVHAARREVRAPRAGLRAIGCMICAVAAFSAMDAILKRFTAHYPPLEVATLRGLASMPFMVVPLLLMRRLRELVPRRLPMHLLRGLLMVLVLGTFVYAVRELSLANAYAIFLSAPLIVTGLSVPLLGDRTEWRRWIAIAIGMGGVLIVLNPSASGFASLGALAALVSAVGYAFNAIALRVITRTDTTSSVVFWTIGIMTCCCALLAAPHWVGLRPADWPWLLGLGAFGAVAQHLLTEAFRSAPPAVVAPFEYTALLWGVGIDYVFWDILPGSRIYLGGGIVIASGLYIIWRERVAH